MLAPLGNYMFIMLMACTTILLICYAYDTYRAGIEAGRSLPVDLEFPVHPQPRRSRVRFPATRLRLKERRSRPPRPRLWSRPGRLKLDT